MFIVNWLVRLALLFVLAVAGTILFFLVKNLFKELNNGSR